MTDLEEIATGLPWIAFAIASATVRHTIVPGRFQGALALIVLVALGGAGIAVARAAGYDLEGGRCRAKTNDGSRCQLSRDPGADLWHVHQNTYEVELHPSAIESEGFAGEVDVAENED